MSVRRVMRISIVLGLCIGLLAMTSQANEQPRTLEELVAEANSIIYGRVVEVTSDTVRIAVGIYLKGEGKHEITLDAASMADAADLAEGEKVFLFLQEGGLQLVGGQQGEFVVVGDLVPEAGGMPVNHFIERIDGILGQQGYVKPIPEKGTEGQPQMSFASDVFDVAAFEAQVGPSDDDGPKELGSEASLESEEAWQTITSLNWEGSFPDPRWALAWAANGYIWDDQSYRDHSGNWSGWCADVNRTGGPDLQAPGPYANNMDARMTHGPFSLVGATDAELHFWHWTKTEPTWDYLDVYASVNGLNWYGRRFTGNIASWQFVNFDLRNVFVLGNLCGRPQVWIQFRFRSDGSVTNEGSYLDDIVLRKWVGGGPNNPPTNGTINPNSGGAACGTIRYFQTSWSDLDGWTDLFGLRFHIGRTSGLRNNAVLLYTPGNNKIKIRNDNSTRWWGGKVLGSNNVVENGQAKVYCNLCTVTRAGNTVTVRWAVEFKCSFRGNKNLYLKAKDRQGAKTLYQWRGTWNIW